MRAAIAIAKKDVTQLFRDRVGFFFVFVFPVAFGILFGLIFSGSGDGPSDIALVVADLDESEASRLVVQRLGNDSKLTLTTTDNESEAREGVRTGAQSGALVIPDGFGAALENMFFGGGAELILVLDPGEFLEGGVIRGSVAEAAYQSMFTAFQGGEASQRMLARGREALAQAEGVSPADRLVFNTLLGSLDNVLAMDGAEQPSAGDADPDGSGTDAGAPFRPITIRDDAPSDEERADPDAPKRPTPDTMYEITFAQAVAWGLMSCVLGFGLGVVSERTRGTLTRLRLAPIARWKIIAGKAIGCFVTCIGVQALILALGVAVFGVRPDSWMLLGFGVLSASVCFVGLAMLLAAMGKTETSSEGMSRAVLLVLALVGGAGVPLAVMPAWLRTAASVSPFKWVIEVLDGALWRQMTLVEALAPCGVLVGIGVGGFVIGVLLFGRQAD
ncbi:MAG: ABC transporter permease [Planctomycetota bacterium]